MRLAFDGRAETLSPDEVSWLTGHAVGGVCRFGVATSLATLRKVSLPDSAADVSGTGSMAWNGWRARSAQDGEIRICYLR
jgi:hypothetical protein